MIRVIRRPSVSIWIKVAAIVALVALSVTALTAAAGRPARLRVPDRAEPGQVISVAGQDFAPGQEGNLTFDGGVVRPFAASRNGTFNLSFRVPTSARHDRGRVSAKTSSGGLLATTTLAIVGPEPSGSPSDSPTVTPTSTVSAPGDSGLPSAPASLPSSGESPSPGAASPAATPSWPAGATASRMSLLAPCPNQPDCFLYRVRSARANGSRVDDNLRSVARFFGVSVDSVLALNPWARLGIRPGQELKLPPPTR